MLIGIDHGNYAVKTPEFEFVAGIREHSVKPPLSDEVLTYRGRHYTLTGKRISYMRDKTRDDRYFILTLFAVAKELDRMGRQNVVEDIELAVGLPPEHYGLLKDKFAAYFRNRGMIEFNVGNRFYRIRIKDVFVFPQAYAAVVPQSSRILDQLRELQVDLRANPAVFLGGGSMVLRKYIENSPLVTMADFIEDPSANAAGYQMLAQGMLQKKSGK